MTNTLHTCPFCCVAAVFTPMRFCGWSSPCGVLEADIIICSQWWSTLLEGFCTGKRKRLFRGDAAAGGAERGRVLRACIGGRRAHVRWGSEGTLQHPPRGSEQEWSLPCLSVEASAWAFTWRRGSVECHTFESGISRDRIPGPPRSPLCICSEVAEEPAGPGMSVQLSPCRLAFPSLHSLPWASTKMVYVKTHG